MKNRICSEIIIAIIIALKFTDHYSVWAYCIFIRKFAAAAKE